MSTPPRATALATDPPRTPLTHRELLICAFVHDGRTVKEIAERMPPGRTGRTPAPRTIESQIENIANKLHNPDKLRPMRLITVWYGHAIWLTRQQTSPECAEVEDEAEADTVVSP